MIPWEGFVLLFRPTIKVSSEQYGEGAGFPMCDILQLFEANVFNEHSLS